MSPERDLFANFERMRREMDELFGDVFERTGLAPRGAAGSRRRSTSTTPTTRRASSCTPSWPASTPTSSALEIQGRELVISGHRRPEHGEGRVYQQLEIEHGPFRRVDSARGRGARGGGEGHLRGRHPARRAPARADRGALADASRSRCRRPRRSNGRGRRVGHRASARGRRRRSISARSASCPARAAACCRCARRSPSRTRSRPLAVGQERSIKLVNDVLGGQPHARDGRLEGPRARDARAGPALRRRRRRRRSRA